MHYVFATFIYLTLICLLFCFTPSTVLAIPMFILGLFIWNVFEYVFHRFAFHNRSIPKIIRRYLTNGHLYHHRYPNKIDNLLLPINLTLPVSMGALLLVYCSFGLDDLAWFYTGLILGLFSYEFMHFAAHHMNINLRVFKVMKQYHLAHHFKSPKKKFMVSCPLMDYFFRTNR